MGIDRGRIERACAIMRTWKQRHDSIDRSVNLISGVMIHDTIKDRNLRSKAQRLVRRWFSPEGQVLLEIAEFNVTPMVEAARLCVFSGMSAKEASNCIGVPTHRVRFCVACCQFVHRVVDRTRKVHQSTRRPAAKR